MADTNTRNRGTAVEDRATTGTAGTSVGLGIAGIAAGIAAVSGFYPVLLGVAAAAIGLLTLIPAITGWQRARSRHGAAAGTNGTNLSIGGAVAAIAALILGVVGITATGGAETVDEGVDGVEQEADQLGDDVEDGL